jgi:hypothetical protein
MPDQLFTTVRATEPDQVALVQAVRTLDATASVWWDNEARYRITKATAWTAPQIAAAQNAIDTAPAITPSIRAQNAVDAYGPLDLAVMRVMLDEINVLRTELNTLRAVVSPPLTPALPMRTETQVRNAVRTKAGQ